MSIQPGDKAPNFAATTDGHGTLSLNDLEGKKTVVYFYPKDDTPGCTKEAIDFADAWPAFEAAGVALVGVSKDSVASHDRFKAKHALPFALASDESGGVVEAYGSWVEKSMYGKSYMGIERSTFLIDEKGVVRDVWRKVRVPGHVDKVLEAVKSL